MKITILYGSETGTAQDVAEQIWKNAKRFCYCPSSIIYIEKIFYFAIRKFEIVNYQKICLLFIFYFMIKDSNCKQFYYKNLFISEKDQKVMSLQ